MAFAFGPFSFILIFAPLLLGCSVRVFGVHILLLSISPLALNPLFLIFYYPTLGILNRLAKND
jgi:hypothetical protein